MLSWFSAGERAFAIEISTGRSRTQTHTYTLYGAAAGQKTRRTRRECHRGRIVIWELTIVPFARVQPPPSSLQPSPWNAWRETRGGGEKKRPLTIFWLRSIFYLRNKLNVCAHFRREIGMAIEFMKKFILLLKKKKGRLTTRVWGWNKRLLSPWKCAYILRYRKKEYNSHSTSFETMKNEKTRCEKHGGEIYNFNQRVCSKRKKENDARECGAGERWWWWWWWWFVHLLFFSRFFVTGEQSSSSLYAWGKKKCRHTERKDVIAKSIFFSQHPLFFFCPPCYFNDAETKLSKQKCEPGIRL